jgi:peroxiredoxin
LVGLRDLARAFPDVRFYAISPDGPQVSRVLDRKVAQDGRGKLGYSLLADTRSTVIDRYGLRDDAYRKEKINGVPHPAVFVLDEAGRIRWSKIESDYRERPSNEEIAAALDAFE